MTEIPDNAVIVDARSRTEYQLNHLSCAKSLPWYETDEPEAANVLRDKTRPVVVYCLSGHRSVTAKKRLEAQGFQSVYDGGSVYSLQRLIAKTRPRSDCSTFVQGR